MRVVVLAETDCKTKLLPKALPLNSNESVNQSINQSINQSHSVVSLSRCLYHTLTCISYNLVTLTIQGWTDDLSQEGGPTEQLRLKL